MRFLAIAVLLLVIAGCGHSSQAITVVAIVDHHRITNAELSTYFQYAVSFDRLAYPDSTEAGCVRRAASPPCRQLRDKVLSRMIQERLVLEYARSRHITLNRADRQAVGVQLTAMAATGAPTARLFHSRSARKAFMRQVIERQLLVQKAEAQIAGAHARRGFEIHITRIIVPATPSNRSIQYQQALAVAGGGSLPPGSISREEWVAPFRLSKPVRSALRGASRGEYVGPFQHRFSFQIIHVLGSGVHRYGRPARATLTARYFRRWLAAALHRSTIRCLGKRGGLGRCAGQIMNAA